MTLDTAATGSVVEILDITGDAASARRLMELGLVPGAHVHILRRAPFGGPMELAIGTIHLGVRLTRDVQVRVAKVPQ